MLTLACALCALRAGAQSAENLDRTLSRLPASSRAIVDRLTSISELTDNTWKMHPGDLTHGEAVDLDDTDWQPVHPLQKTSADVVWFRQTYTVPGALQGYDLTGSRIWFQFRFHSHGPRPQVVYFNGRRVAMGEDLEPVILFDDARPGQTINVAVKLLRTSYEKTFLGAQLPIEFLKLQVTPAEMRTELLSATDLITSLGENDSARMGTLAAAIGSIDTSALDRAQTQSGAARSQSQAAFDASLTVAQRKLEPLLPVLQTFTWHLTGNSHIDAAWLWPWTETVDVVKRTFSTALQLMHEYPQYTYTQSAAAYNEWMAQKYPELNQEVHQRIKEGRWEVVGGMWVEPDLNMPDGESLVRQLLVGKRWYLQNYGVDVHVGWNPDSFGYTWQLPQIYKKSGIDYFVTQKMRFNDTNQLPFKLFWWESPDGSKVLTYFPEDYTNGDLSPIRLSQDTLQARQRAPGLTELMDLYGVGDHGGGPTRYVLDEGLYWATPSQPSRLVPKMEFGTAQQFFTSISRQVSLESHEWNYQSIAEGYTISSPVEGKIAIPTWNSEMYLEFHRGVTTTQADFKKSMRESEEEILDAEKWASVGWLYGWPYAGSELTEDWKKALFNQFHDLAAGSGVAAIYKDAEEDYKVVRWSTNQVTAAALHAVSARIATDGLSAGSIPIVVWNPLGWRRTGDISITVQNVSPSTRGYVWSAGTRTHDMRPAQIISVDERTGVMTLGLSGVSVPAVGYTVVHLFPSDRRQAPPATVSMIASSSGFVLKNEKIAVTVDRTTGCITSLRERGSAFETIAPGACGNQLQFFHDNPKDNDAWNIDPGTLEAEPMTIEKADSVESVIGSNATPAIRITSHFQQSNFTQTISLAPDSDIVDVENDIDWHESHILLKAAFPLAATGPFATYEIPYGTIDRPTTRNNSWEKAQFEAAAIRWVDLGDGKHGCTILNQDKYGYDAVGNLLRLTLLRSPKWPDPNADMGRHHFHYAIYPHQGTWKDALTMRHGWEYNYPLFPMLTSPHPGSLPAEQSFASVTPDNVVLTAVKKAEDADGLIFRAYEWAGKGGTAEFQVPSGAHSATVTNLMEQPQGKLLKVEGGVVTVPLHPYEILTIRVDYSPQP